MEDFILNCKQYTLCNIRRQTVDSDHVLLPLEAGDPGLQQCKPEKCLT